MLPNIQNKRNNLEAIMELDEAVVSGPLLFDKPAQILNDVLPNTPMFAVDNEAQNKNESCP